MILTRRNGKPVSGMFNAWEQWEGQVVNGVFRLGEYLGGDECSAVFLTEVVQREPKKAAIKLVPADSENAELQLSSWHLAAKLSHPHLMQLFSMGHCQLGEMELLYVVMEYAEENLSQVLGERPLASEEAREMLEPVLDALAFLHSKGFVHGHMKPANIMAVDNQLKISIDGLCRVSEPSGVRGKLTGYDPPELAGGELQPASDVWSLGITLVEVLTQRVPVWARAGREDPVVPRSLPPPFLDLARHCLVRDPGRRSTVADLADELRQISIPSAASTPQGAFAKRRYIAPAVALGLLFAAILVGPRLFKHGPATQPAASIVEQPKLPPKPEPIPATPQVTPAIRQSSQGVNDEKPGPSPATPKPRASDARPETSNRGRVRGEVLNQVLPAVPRKARETIQGKVRVRVRIRVSPSGSVAGATLDSPGPSRYFAGLALQAAQRWKFAPAIVDGREVASQWV